MTIGMSQPLSRAHRAFSSVLTVPITRAPRYLAHWQSKVPTPPAAAWTRTVSPGTHRMGAMQQIFGGHALEQQRRRGLDVDAAGTGTTWSAGRVRRVA